MHGDGNRVKKTEGGQTILYVNKYYEKNLTTGEVTTYYYHGDKLVAKRAGTILQYIHQDHLTGSSAVSSSAGSLVNSIKYLPFGATRSGDVPTDKKFTGQRLDTTGLYYYNARYHDPNIGRFISPDTVVPGPSNPQAWNRYAYALNNPTKYTDPSGHDVRMGSAYNLSFKGGVTYLQGLGTASADANLLLQAWDTFESVAPDQAKLMEASSEQYVRGRDPWSGAVTVDPPGGTTWIGIENGINEPARLAAIIAHESYHAAYGGGLQNSITEEVAAYKYQAEIEISLKILDPSSTAGHFAGFDFGLKRADPVAYNTALVDARDYLKGVGLPQGNMYGNLPLDPTNGAFSLLQVGGMALDLGWGWVQTTSIHDWYTTMMSYVGF
jgi:RHS repeat-associated protein